MKAPSVDVAAGPPVVVEAITNGTVDDADTELPDAVTGALLVLTGAIVPVQTARSGQQAAWPAPSAEQTCPF